MRRDDCDQLGAVNELLLLPVEEMPREEPRVDFAATSGEANQPASATLSGSAQRQSGCDSSGSHYANGLIRVTPHPAKSRTFRVAKLSLWTSAVAAINISAWVR